MKHTIHEEIGHATHLYLYLLERFLLNTLFHMTKIVCRLGRETGFGIGWDWHASATSEWSSCVSSGRTYKLRYYSGIDTTWAQAISGSLHKHTMAQYWDFLWCQSPSTTTIPHVTSSQLNACVQVTKQVIIISGSLLFMATESSCKNGRLNVTKHHQWVFQALDKCASQYHNHSPTQNDMNYELYDVGLDETGTVSSASLTDSDSKFLKTESIQWA